MKSKYCVKFFKQVRMHVCLRFENGEGVIHVLEGGEPVVASGKIPRLHLFVAQKFVQIEVVRSQQFFQLLVTETGLHRRAAFARHFDEFLNAGHVRREEMIIGEIEEQGAPFRPEIAKLSMKTAKYVQEENKEDLTDMADTGADIISDAVKKVASSVNDGMRKSKFCKHCGAEIDEDSRYCSRCGKEQ